MERYQSKTVLLPSQEAADLDENLNNDFKQFNDDLQTYFNNFTQAVGTVKFDKKRNNYLSMYQLITMKAETIQYYAVCNDQAEKYFDDIDEYEIHY